MTVLSIVALVVVVAALGWTALSVAALEALCWRNDQDERTFAPRAVPQRIAP